MLARLLEVWLGTLSRRCEEGWRGGLCFSEKLLPGCVGSLKSGVISKSRVGALGCTWASGLSPPESVGSMFHALCLSVIG